MEIFFSESASETLKIGKSLVRNLVPGTVIALKGNLGSGKTTLVKGIAEGLGITETITSPTFTLISEYEGILPLYHMDLYRISSVEEFELTGAEELIYGTGITAIEWSEKAESILPDQTVYVTINIEPDGKRSIRVEKKS